MPVKRSNELLTREVERRERRAICGDQPAERDGFQRVITQADEHIIEAEPLLQHTANPTSGYWHASVPCARQAVEDVHAGGVVGSGQDERHAQPG